MRIIYMEDPNFGEMYLDPIAYRGVAINRDTLGMHEPQLTTMTMNSSWRPFRSLEEGARELEVEKKVFDSLMNAGTLNDSGEVEKILARHFAPLLE